MSSSQFHHFSTPKTKICRQGNPERAHILHRLFRFTASRALQVSSLTCRQVPMRNRKKIKKRILQVIGTSRFMYAWGHHHWAVYDDLDRINVFSDEWGKLLADIVSGWIVTSAKIWNISSGNVIGSMLTRATALRCDNEKERSLNQVKTSCWNELYTVGKSVVQRMQIYCYNFATDLRGLFCIIHIICGYSSYLSRLEEHRTWSQTWSSPWKACNSLIAAIIIITSMFSTRAFTGHHLKCLRQTCQHFYEGLMNENSAGLHFKSRTVDLYRRKLLKAFWVSWSVPEMMWMLTTSQQIT